MPNYFSMTRKSEPEAGPVAFVKIDEEMCKHFNVDCHPKHWFLGWYEYAGFSIACGKTLPELIEREKESLKNDPDNKLIADYLKVLEWLNDNFTTEAWATVGN